MENKKAIWQNFIFYFGFAGGSVVKSPPPSAGHLDLNSGSEDHLEKEMATHFTILAWEIPWTEEPDRLQSMGTRLSDYCCYC